MDASNNFVKIWENTAPTGTPAFTMHKDALAGTQAGLVFNLLGGNDIVNIASNVGVATTINGGEGNDTINAGGGNDSIDGGAGDDSIYGSAGNDSLTGGAGADRLEGQDGNDHFWSQDGIADQLFGGNGTDIAWTNDPSDTLNSIEGLGGPPPPPPGGPSP